MSEDKVISQAIEIPGMQITFGGPISPDNKGLTFVLAADALISPLALRERLDTVAAEFRRQAAIEELPIVRQSLAANQKLLKTAIHDRATHVAQMNGRVEQLAGRRRSEVHAPPQDVNALSQHDNRILQIEGQIEGAKQRIPYLEALRAGVEPPDPEGEPVRMAAE